MTEIIDSLLSKKLIARVIDATFTYSEPQITIDIKRIQIQTRIDINVQSTL